MIAILGVLTADASGVLSLFVPETCAIEEAGTCPEGGCPAFCVRCSCVCCASSIDHAMPSDVAVAELLPMTLVPVPASHMPAGAVSEILHIPKTLLA
ncbi:MAG: hypothetical protein ABJC89_20765 [Acidobacteriota bacterium]